MFEKNQCRVYYKDKIVLTGGRDPVTELWKLPINPTAIHNAHTALSHLDLAIPVDTLKVGMQSIHQASNAHKIPYKKNQPKYTHQSLFSPSIATLNQTQLKFSATLVRVEGGANQKKMMVDNRENELWNTAPDFGGA